MHNYEIDVHLFWIYCTTMKQKVILIWVVFIYFLNIKGIISRYHSDHKWCNDRTEYSMIVYFTSPFGVPVLIMKWQIINCLWSIGRDGSDPHCPFQRHDFKFHGTNFEYQSSNFPFSPAYFVFILQLIWYSRFTPLINVWFRGRCDVHIIVLDRDLSGNKIVFKEIIWSIRDFHQTIRSLPLQIQIETSTKMYTPFFNRIKLTTWTICAWHLHVTWHLRIWPYTVTSLLLNYLVTKLDLVIDVFPHYQIPGGFHRTFATGAASQQRSPGSVLFGLAFYSNVATRLFWTCHISRLWIANTFRYF